jgi:hypothetical protein
MAYQYPRYKPDPRVRTAKDLPIPRVVFDSVSRIWTVAELKIMAGSNRGLIQAA